MKITRSPTRRISGIEIDADIPMADHKLTGLVDGDDNEDSISLLQSLDAISFTVGLETTARELADTIHQDKNTDIHGVGVSTICSLVEALIIGKSILCGLAADKPDATDVVEGTYYIEVDTRLTYMTTAGTWVVQAFASPWILTDATLADFQAIAASGTINNPTRVNDTATDSASIATSVTKYAEIDYGKWVEIDQWRIFGDNANNEDGAWKLEYYGTDLSWHDWVTGIATNKAVWSVMASEDEVICSKIRITCTVLDSNDNRSALAELEVYHS